MNALAHSGDAPGGRLRWPLFFDERYDAFSIVLDELELVRARRMDVQAVEARIDKLLGEPSMDFGVGGNAHVVPKEVVSDHGAVHGGHFRRIDVLQVHRMYGRASPGFPVDLNGG